LNFDVKSLESGLKSFRIEIPVQDVNNGLKSCYKSLRKEASIPGFRKGRAPINILKVRFADYIRGEIFRDLIYPACQEAMESSDIFPLGDIEFVPNLDEIEIEEDKPVVFEIIVPVKPKIDLPEYEEIHIDKSGINITEEEVDDYIEGIRQEHAEFITIEEDRPVHEGDFAKFDWTYYEDGEFSAEGKDDLVEVKPENPDAAEQQRKFSEELIGMKVGDEKDIELSFDDDYPDPNLAGKLVKYHISLKEICKKVLPELDDEFAKELKYDSYEQMHSSIWNSLVEGSKAELNKKQREEIVDELIEKTDFEVPDSLVEKQAKSISESIKRSLRREGITSKEIEAEIESRQSEIFSQALRDIKQFWIFDKIIEREDIQVTDEELERQIRLLARYQNRDPQKYTEMLKANGSFENFRRSMIEEKVFDFLIENSSEKQKIIL